MEIGQLLWLLFPPVKVQAVCVLLVMCSLSPPPYDVAWCCEAHLREGVPASPRARVAHEPQCGTTDGVRKGDLPEPFPGLPLTHLLYSFTPSLPEKVSGSLASSLVPNTMLAHQVVAGTAQHSFSGSSSSRALDPELPSPFKEWSLGWQFSRNFHLPHSHHQPP